MTIEEKKNMCTQIFLAWKFSNKDWTVHDDEIMDGFIPKVLVKKMKAFCVDIILPDPLLLMIEVCTEGNPGQAQIVLKELLNNIVSTKGKIKPGYIITLDDFVDCYPTFPIIALDEEGWRKKWDNQKGSNVYPGNLCDTPDWWLEVMED